MNEVYWSDKRHEMEGSDWSAEEMARAIPYMLKERVATRVATIKRED